MAKISTMISFKSTFFVRIEQLNHFKEKAELLEKARKDPSLINDKVTHFNILAMSHLELLHSKAKLMITFLSLAFES